MRAMATAMAAAGGLLALPATAAAGLDPGPWKVTRVVDGDTLYARLGRTEVKVRLVGIDAPETYGGLECYGRGARRALEAMAPVGTRVRLLLDPREDEQDRYGRWLAYVMKDGTNVNVRLVRAGAAARGYWSFGTPTAAGALTRAEARAYRLRRGAWGACPQARRDRDPLDAWDTGAP